MPLAVCGSAAPSPAQTHLRQCPECGPRRAGGSGKVWLHCSSPSCTGPRQARADGSSHTGQSQSHRKLQGPEAVGGADPATPSSGAELLLGVPPCESGPGPGCKAPTWPRAGSVLEEQVIQCHVGALHPSGHGRERHLGRYRVRCAHKWSGQPLGVRKDPCPGTHPPGPLGLHSHTAQAPGEPSALADAEHLPPVGLLHVHLQGTCHAQQPAQVSSSGGGTVSAGSGPCNDGLPGGLGTGA